MAVYQEQPDGSLVLIEPDFTEQPTPLPCELPVVGAAEVVSTQQNEEV